MQLVKQEQAQAIGAVSSQAIARFTAAVLIIVATAWIAYASMASRTTAADPAVATPMLNPALTEFRRGERSVEAPVGLTPDAGFVDQRHGEQQVSGGSTVEPGPGLTEFRHGEQGR